MYATFESIKENNKNFIVVQDRPYYTLLFSANFHQDFCKIATLATYLSIFAVKPDFEIAFHSNWFNISQCEI